MSRRGMLHEPITEKDRPRLEQNVVLSFNDRFKTDFEIHNESVAAVIIPDIRFFWAYYDAFGEQDRDKVIDEAVKVMMGTRAIFPDFRYHRMLQWDKFLCTYIGEPKDIPKIADHIVSEFEKRQVEPQSTNALRAMLAMTQGIEKQMTFGQRSYIVKATHLERISEDERYHLHPEKCTMKVGAAYFTTPYARIGNRHQMLRALTTVVMESTLPELRKRLNGNADQDKLRYQIDKLDNSP